MTEQRRLAAIVSADVAGYSRLMGRDESGTLAALKALRQEVVDPAIAAHAHADRQYPADADDGDAKVDLVETGDGPPNKFRASVAA
jgi:class 3 adenylate cyclase